MPTLIEIEKSLIRNQWPTSFPNPPSKSHATQLAHDLIHGNFKQVLTSPPARHLFRVNEESSSLDLSLEENFVHLLGRVDEQDEEEDELTRLIIAIALLHSFVQANWTGPDLSFHPSDILSSSSSPSSPSSPSSSTNLADSLNAKSISELAYKGEPAYHLCRYPLFLRLAQLVLLPVGTLTFKRVKTAPLWVLRLTLLHQQVIDEPVPPEDFVLKGLEESVESLVEVLTTAKEDVDLAARVLLTQGLLFHLLSQDKQAAAFFNRAVQATGLRYELTGALGKRTKFQQEDLSQLVVLAESSLNVNDTTTTTTLTQTNATHHTVPKSLALNDDTLLETTHYTTTATLSTSSPTPSSQSPLHPLDQTLLLALTQSHIATSPSPTSDPLTSSQSSAFLARVLSHPQNWSIHTMALLARSRLESNRTRTVERAVLQIQALVDQMPATGHDDASVRERLEYFWELLLPNRWALEKELADKLCSIGVVKSALEIYEKLETWEQVVQCYSILEKPEKGIEIVKDLLEGRRREAEVVVVDGKATISKERRTSLDRAREAKLLCLLGDLEPAQALDCYTRAWDVSLHTSSRAVRSLGGLYFSQANYPTAIECLRKAVNINPLVGRAWFLLGCACMRVEDWEGSREAFTRCVRIDEEDSESWSNLAAVYLRMPSGVISAAPDVNNTASESIPIEHKLLAYRALKHGLRFSYNNWKMWYNYMIVSVDVGEFFEAARALGRVVDETSGRSGSSEPMLDLDVVDRLVDAVTKGAQGSAVGDLEPVDASVQDSQQPTGLTRAVTQLFEATLLPRVSSSPRLFRAYAKLMMAQGRWEDVLKAYMDAYRLGVAGTWGSSSPGDSQGTADTFKEAVREVEEMVDVLRNFGPKAEGERWKAQARSIVRTLMARTKEVYEGEEGWDALVGLANELKSSE